MVSEEKNRVIEMKLQDNELTLFAHSHLYGSGRENIPVEYTGAAFNIKFNPRYLLDIFNHINGEHVTIKFKDQISPVLFCNSEKDHNLYVLMPICI